jgi:DNA replication and repair protein RecF
LREYRKILKARNLLIKSNNDNYLDIVDIQLAKAGKILIDFRNRMIKDVSFLFSEIFNEISGISNVTLEYRPSWKNLDNNQIIELLASRRKTDALFLTTTTGPHRDNIIFLPKMEKILHPKHLLVSGDCLHYFQE